MAVSRALRRLLRIRELQEEQSRLALASLPDSEYKRALLWVPDFVVAREK